MFSNQMMWSSFHKQNVTRIILLAVLVLSATGNVRGERKNSIGASVNFIAGGSNQLGESSSFKETDISAFYSVYPSVMLNSKGEHSSIGLQYHFAAERFQLNEGVTVTSHRVSGNIQSQLSRRHRLKLSYGLNSMSDYSMLNVLKNISPNPDEYQFIFEPELFERSNISSNAGISWDAELTGKSFITFSGSSTFRFYDNETESSSLSDQIRVEGGFSYSRRTTDHSTWHLKYTVRQNEFERYDRVRSHITTIGLTRKLSPKWSLNVAAGASFIEQSGIEQSDTGYEVNADISRQSRNNWFSAGYFHHAADSTGLGGSTELDQGFLSFSQMLGRSASIELDGAVYRQDLYDAYGGRGSAAISRRLGRYWNLSVGGSYLRDRERSSARFYVSLGFSINQQRPGSLD